MATVIPFRKPAPVPSLQLPDICPIDLLPDDVVASYIKVMARDNLRVELFAFLCSLCASDPLLLKPGENFRYLLPHSNAVRVPQLKDLMEV